MRPIMGKAEVHISLRTKDPREAARRFPEVAKRVGEGWEISICSAACFGMKRVVDAFVPLTFAPGEAYQFDWSHEIIVMDGVTTIMKVAHLRLCHSRMMFVRA